MFNFQSKWLDYIENHPILIKNGPILVYSKSTFDQNLIWSSDYESDINWRIMLTLDFKYMFIQFLRPNRPSLLSAIQQLNNK